MAARQPYLIKFSLHGASLKQISNNHRQLWPMLDTLVRQLGLATRRQLFAPTPAQLAVDAKASERIASAREDADLAFLDGTTQGWKDEQLEPRRRGLWR